ncbi:putative HTH transcriptional regulator [Anaerosolibacter carboniphilus]|uniref:Putative HTH transcriptional regulator n=1 Tax=Anaerosolibacter carboniphilus TaxID=1417629 RepID=A0A841KQD3_9FIRM|nr:RNA-binding domain-containing protein [Anaerosolibacter carboniphilus]MBB6215637.1 putative HTH transcriptional regulator [Anaerosolibacter carboniphilus]
MDVQRLKMLIKQEEGSKLDFKESLLLNTESAKKELAKDIIAIANSIGGRGHIIIGIKDKSKEIVGIDPIELHEERIQQIISYRCDPPINLRVEHIEIENKCVCVITIFKSYQRPHQMRQTGTFYIRRGSTTDFARRDEIARMFQEIGLISNELIPLYNLDTTVLDRELINNYLKKISLNPSTDMEKSVWHNVGIIHHDAETGKTHPTMGGMLLFCKNPQIYLPYCSVTIVHYEGHEQITQPIHGDIMEMLNRCYGYISEILKDQDYPIEAIFEGIANAVLHRDYFDLTRNIVVFIGDNKIEISNPGNLPRGQNMYTILKDRNPSRRNRWLYDKLLVLDENNRFLKTGFGIYQMNKIFEDIGNVMLLNIEKRSLFKIILPGLKKYKKQGKI